MMPRAVVCVLLLQLFANQLVSAQNGPWINIASVPDSLGEVAAAQINGIIYLVGQQTAKTYAYTIATDTWVSNLAPRPIKGDHHAAVVPGDGTIWLVGGFSGADGTIQVYNIATNSWRTLSLPSGFGGSMIAVHVNGIIYACGGITAGTTIKTCTQYNMASNTFSTMASLPMAVNHAGYATDGTNIFVIGGRTGPNVPSPGFNYVQIYNIASGTWAWSGAFGSTIASLPTPRGGMGSGVYLNGSIYIMGGETTARPPTNGVFNNVDIYDTVLNTWSSGTPLPVARHGFYPVTDGQYIYLPAGGVIDGYSTSTYFTKLAISTVAPQSTSPTTTNTATTTQTTTVTTTTVTTTPQFVATCPSSNLLNIMLCQDGSSCNVLTSTTAWACCATHMGRLACPSEKPVMCPTYCGTDHCCAVTLALCAGTGAAFPLTSCPTLLVSTTAPASSTTKALTSSAPASSTTKVLTSSAPASTSTSKATTATTSAATTIKTSTVVSTASTTKAAAITSTQTPSCPMSGLLNIMLCRDGTSCNVVTSPTAWACCATHMGRLACPKEKPVMCPTYCGTDHCCAVTLALCAGTGAAFPLTSCPTLAVSTTAATTTSTTTTAAPTTATTTATTAVAAAVTALVVAAMGGASSDFQPAASTTGSTAFMAGLIAAACGATVVATVLGVAALRRRIKRHHARLVLPLGNSSRFKDPALEIY